MEYREYPPYRALAASVHCIWTLEGDAAAMASDDQPILPDGKSELVVHLADPFDRVHADGRIERQPAVLFAGQLTSQLVLRPTGKFSVVGIRFRPDGAAAILREPQDRLAGLTPSVLDLSPGLARALQSARDTSNDVATVVAALQTALEGLVRPAADARVRHVVEQIRRARGMVSVRELAAAVGWTPRIARFQHALALLDQRAPAPGTRTAAACGFADQAHFVRDFRELAGVPPGEHLLKRGELTGLFRDQLPASSS
jgi:AraC-like DNA-binding protein